ncbi:uncharacterized protein B0H64DRAFT_418199 [Chaetomium fimeti]|uniref:Uncharacterized protein n=1 Tax=Chaetomium fimeti TaxID=1854472 RepID=A0AAE0LQX4_9PEZI|nr:hypothetical protein B0H64DRAFT_418199 [Chaetomium fimeti]
MAGPDPGVPFIRVTGSGRRAPGAVCPGPAPPSRRFNYFPNPLDSLPHVVIGNILGWLPRDDCFWRCVTAMHVAKALSVATVQPLRIVPLSWLVSWERGSPPKVASGDAVENVPSLVRFTIDRDGLSKVEKLVEPPQFNRQRFDDKAFVIEREDVFGPSLAVFKLSLLEDFEDYKFAVWDTPTPPDLAHCPITLERPLSIRRYHSVDLTAVTGITFFILGGSIFGAHGHTRARPSAMATYQHLGRRVRDLEKYGDWVYVPLPPGDTVRAVGDCRLHVDPSTTFERPSRLAFLDHKEYGEGVEVLFDALPSADDPGLDNWLYYEMKGTLDFWLHPRNESISVRGGAQIPQMDLWEEVPEGE